MTESNAIPYARARGAIDVSDGLFKVGTIVQRDKSFFAFGLDEVLIGEFASLQLAMRAIPKEQTKRRKQ
jgi:hypothetical protein